MMKFPHGGYNSCELIKVCTPTHSINTLTRAPTLSVTQPPTHSLTPGIYLFLILILLRQLWGTSPNYHHVKCGRILVSHRGGYPWCMGAVLSSCHLHSCMWTETLEALERVSRASRTHRQHTNSLICSTRCGPQHVCYTTPKEGHVHGPPHRGSLKN